LYYLWQHNSFLHLLLILLVAGVNIFMEDKQLKKLAIAILATCSKSSTMQGVIHDAIKFYEMIEQRIDKDENK
jgi:hypothetical protein